VADAERPVDSLLFHRWAGVRVVAALPPRPTADLQVSVEPLALPATPDGVIWRSFPLRRACLGTVLTEHAAQYILLHARQ
jgi:hypothetical protein